MKPPSILIVDDHPVIRRGLCTLLESESGWSVVGEAASGREAIEKAEDLQPDVVILDLSMPEISGEKAIRPICGGAANPRADFLDV